MRVIRARKPGCVCSKMTCRLLYPKLREADAIVIASPIYWFTMNAQTKLFIDRWYALESPQGNALKGKQFGILLTLWRHRPLQLGGDQRHPVVSGYVPIHWGEYRGDGLRNSEQ